MQQSNETFVIHYQQTYSEPELPPIWAMTELISLGALRTWIAATELDSKTRVARSMGVPSAQRPGSRSRQVIDGHWEGLLPPRQQREEQRSLRDGNARCDQEQRPVRSSELARPLAVYAELIGEVAA